LQRATSDGASTTFAFDDAGRRLSQSGSSPRTYAYDAAGRLTSVGSATWTYDGEGLRRSATDATATTARFTWVTVEDQPMLLSDGTSRFIYGPDGMPLAQIAEDGATEWFHIDQAGSVSALTDDAGTVVATFAFDAYGLPTARTGAATTRLGFQGGYTDADSGLQYLLARVYDPGTGQFLTVDPAVMQTQQPYAFASGDPITFGDPTGLDTVLAGHGRWSYTDGFTTVPEGTTVIFHTPPGWGIEDNYGNTVEQGGHGAYEQRYGPYSLIPNYILSAPDGLNVEKTSTTVSSPTPLGQLLKPRQGDVHWAACRVYRESSAGAAAANAGSPSFDPWVDDHVRVARNSTYDPFAWTVDSAVIFGEVGRHGALPPPPIRADPGYQLGEA
jgi:RHS repeat-associated protein